MNFQFNTHLEYERAGVRFNIALNQAPGAAAADFLVTTEDLEGRPLQMTHQVAPRSARLRPRLQPLARD